MMNSNGVHYLAYGDIKDRLIKIEEEYKQVSRDLNEAISLGDLRENSEYDAAKERMSKVTRERDMLTPFLSMPVVKSNDNVVVFEEGSVIQLDVYSLTKEPIGFNEEIINNLKNSKPVISSILMLGGVLPIHSLLGDSALATDTPVGEYLIGKVPGAYSIKVPGGFANVIVNKLKSSTTAAELFCDCSL